MRTGSACACALPLVPAGANGTLMGLCLSANCAAEVPVFYYSGRIIEHLGVERAFTLAMCAYVLRVCCYVVRLGGVEEVLAEC